MLIIEESKHRNKIISPPHPPCSSPLTHQNISVFSLIQTFQNCICLRVKYLFSFVLFSFFLSTRFDYNFLALTYVRCQNHTPTNKKRRNECSQAIQCPMKAMGKRRMMLSGASIVLIYHHIVFILRKRICYPDERWPNESETCTPQIIHKPPNQSNAEADIQKSNAF